MATAISAIPASIGRLDLGRVLPIAILVGGCLNGFAARLIDNALTNGMSLPFFGLSPFDVIALVAATVAIAGAPTEHDSRVRPTDLVALAGLLIPSSVVAWVVVAIYAVVVASRSNGAQRQGAVLFLALALSGLWSVAFSKWLVGPATTFDAWWTAWLLSLFQAGVEQTGNVIKTASGHGLVVLAACSSLEAMPRALTGVAAVALLAGTPTPTRIVKAVGLAALALFVCNTLRLMLIASSGEGYDIGHGAIGSNAYDVLQTLVTLGAGYWGGRK